MRSSIPVHVRQDRHDTYWLQAWFLGVHRHFLCIRERLFNAFFRFFQCEHWNMLSCTQTFRHGCSIGLVYVPALTC